MGDRTRNSMISFISSVVSNDILNIDKEWKDSKGKKVMLFMNRITIPPQYINLYLNYAKHDIEFGYSRDDKVFNEYDIKKSGTFIFMNDGKMETYKGPSKLSDVSMALERFFSIEK